MKTFDRPALTQSLRQGAQALAVPLTDSQSEHLIEYLALLFKWNATYNLTAVRDPAQMVTQHLLDSLAVIPAFKGAVNVLDVGAGGGLPGMVLAIWGVEAQPDMRVSLIDTVHKKTAFLTQVKAELGLQQVCVYTARVEQLQVPQKFDVITSRAFAELADFIQWSQHLLTDDGRFIAMKGVAPQQELSRLPPGWRAQMPQRITVPGMDAERHLIFIDRA